MPKRIILTFPVLYAFVGGWLWWNYAHNWPTVVGWVALQIVFFLCYDWLLGRKALGLMMRFHLIVTAIGMLLLFYVLMPGRDNVATDQVLLELVLMIIGTFFCAAGLFSLLHMTIRKLYRDPQIKRRLEKHLGEERQN